HQLRLDREIPRPDLRRTPVFGISHGDYRRHDCRRGIGSLWPITRGKRILHAGGAVRIREVHEGISRAAQVHLLAERRRGAHLVVGLEERRLIGESDTAADRGGAFSGHVPGEPEARGELSPSIVTASLRASGVARIDIADRRVGIALRLRAWRIAGSLSVILRRGSKRVPAETEVDREVTSGAHIVLDEKTSRPVLADAVFAAALLQTVQAAEIEVRHGVARAGSGAARESEIPDLAQRVVILHMHAEE